MQLLRSRFPAFALLFLAACTQAPAPVVMRGQEDFGRRRVSAAQQEAQESIPVPARVESVEESNLPPPGGAPASSPFGPPTPAPQQVPPQAMQPPMSPPVQVPAAAQAAPSFTWPMQGSVVAHFGASDADTSREGILIAGTDGEPVYASADGEVVYAGNQIKAYGTMVVLRHAGDFFSSYAHLSRMAAALHARLHQGDLVGYLGAPADGTTPTLLFSIHKGKEAVDPERYLPAR